MTDLTDAEFVACIEAMKERADAAWHSAINELRWADFRETKYVREATLIAAGLASALQKLRAMRRQAAQESGMVWMSRAARERTMKMRP